MDTKSGVVMKDQFDRIQAAKLKIHNKKFSVYKGVNVIGRNKSATIDVKNLNVSQYHALIIIIDDFQHFISDLNSSNGTYLFDTKLSPFKLYELSNDTEVKFGDVIGLYLKMPNTSSTIHLESESMDTPQPSQTFTQTFYAANTQLLPDDSALNQTVSFKVPQQPSLARDTEDAHEAVTQDMDYPLMISNGNSKLNEASDLIIETVSSDDHDALTQVVDQPLEQPSTSKMGKVDIHEAPTQLVSDRVEENVHKLTSQVVDVPQEKINSDNKKGDGNEDSDSTTQIVTPVNSEKLTTIVLPSTSNNIKEMVNVSVNQDPVVEDSVIEDSIVEENAKEHQHNAIINENSNDSVDFLSISKQLDMETVNDKDSNECGDKHSTISDSQEIGQTKKRLIRKLSSSEDLSENNEPTCNSNSETDVEDNDDLKKKTQKNKTNNSDSDTDVERELPQKHNRNKIIDSDSETDIEDGEQELSLTGTDDIVKSKVLSKNINFESDSETDIEDNKENEPKEQTENRAATDIMNDTDCISSTQDAFANMFEYKNSKPSDSNVNSQSSSLELSCDVSSEDSFKLGLTELMIDEELKSKLEEVDKESEEDDTEIKTKRHISTARKTMGKPTEDKLYMISTQKINEKEPPGNRDDAIYLMPSQMLPGGSSKEPPGNRDDDIYLMPTQMLPTTITLVKENDDTEIKTKRHISTARKTMEKPTEDKLYMISSQKINEKKPPGNRDGDIYLMPTQMLPTTITLVKENDDTEIKSKRVISTARKTMEKPTEDKLYMISTQKINEKEPPGNRDDDIYLMPTQMLPTTITPVKENDPCLPRMTIIEEKEADDNMYLMPTQKLTAKSTEATEDDDVYMMATQNLNKGDANFKVPQKFTFKKKSANLDGSLTSILGSKLENDPYSMPTQKIDEVDDIYMQPTQTLDEIKSQKEKAKNEINDAYTEATQVLNNAGPSDEQENVEDPYEALTQQLDQVLINKESLEAPKVNPYEMETQKLEMVGDQSEESIPNFAKTADDDLFDQPTQILSSVVKENQNQSANTSKDVSNTGATPSSSTKRERDTSREGPKKKRMKKSDIENLKKTIESKSRAEDAETASAIEAFVKKPLEKNETEIHDDRPETLSQIEAFIKKPLNDMKECQDGSGSSNVKRKTEDRRSVGTKTLNEIEVYLKKQINKLASKITKDTSSVNEDEEVDRVETLSQIEAFVKQPLKVQPPSSICATEKSVEQKPVAEKSIPLKHVKNATRTNRGRQSRIIKEADKPENQTTTKSKSAVKLKGETSSDEGYVEQKDCSTDKNITSHTSLDTIKSDIDQSFALLEAKSSKTRKSLRATGSSEIKVAVCRNRRSMTTTSIAELPENEDTIKPSTRKTWKTTAVDNPEPSTSGTKVGVKSKRKPEAAKVEQKPDDSSDSDFSEHETPAKIMKANVVRRGKAKGKVNDKATAKPVLSKESSGGKFLTPSTSKVRANSRVKSTESVESSKSSDSENTTGSNNPSFSTPSRRGGNAGLNEALLKSAERTKRKQRLKVVFTMLDNPLLESYIKQLGGSVVDNVVESSVLVTEHVKRSQKLLAAVGLGKPICSPSWVYASKKAKEFLDPWEHILVDKEAETKWNFSLKDAISKATNEKLLSNYTFQLMVNNAVDVLKGAIEACGGKCVTRAPAKNAEGFFIIVASPENRSKYLKAKKQNPEVIVVEPEAIFDGVLRQDLRLGRHLLT